MSFEEKFNELLRGNVVGSQAVIYKNGETFQYNFGYSSLEEKKEVEDSTIFRIASISKIVVAMAALKLHEEGRLNIDADLSDIFGYKIRNPHYPDVPITTKMLMLHTSSINDGFDDENRDYDNLEVGYNGVNGRSYFVKLEDLLSNKDSKYYTDKTFLNKLPGTHFEYSNFGTGILACVVEKCSGMLFTEYVFKYILKPLGVDASFRASEIEKKEMISDTFLFNNEFKTYRTSKSFIDNTYPFFEVGQNFRGPAGGLFISMQDLARVMITLMNDGIYEDVQILKKETVDLMLQMHYLGPRTDYLAKGLQLKFIDPIPNLLLKGHNGSAYGVSSYMYFSKEENLGICFIANGGNYKAARPGLNNIQANVLDAFIEEFYEQRQNIVLKFNINNNFAHLNNRKILLKDPQVINEEVYLDLLDTANILNVIPRIIEDKVYINDFEVEFVKGKIALFKLLDSLEIHYARVLDNYEIYL